MKALRLLILFAALGTMSVQAQEPANPTQVEIQGAPKSPLYTITVNVVERTTKAINYRNRSGETKVDFHGTLLLPDAAGEAKVESQKGYTAIDVEFEKLQSATRYGPEYLTYVLWAITPEGRAKNLGEILLDGTKGRLEVTTELQAFGLIVTAEPYFAVAQPSDVVVMENVVRKDTVGKIEAIDAKYELLQRGLYTVNVRPSELKAMPLDKKTPIELYEARNAIRIAQWAGADRDAADSFQRAEQFLRQAENTKERKTVMSNAREAAQTAEDARLIAVKRQADQRIAEDRQASAERELRATAQAERARSQAEEDARLRAQADMDRRLEAERRSRAEAERAAAQAQAAVAEVEAAAAKERATKDQAAAEQARQVAALKDEQTRRANAQADEARRAAALRDEQARQAAAQAEKDKADLRATLEKQLNLILETRETARGLIVNISDVLFDFDQYTLKPGAREKLAKVSGIVISHPGLKLEVEGHTDSVGSDDYNQRLSEKRAAAVRSFLAEQGIPAADLSARGLGKSAPVASNDTVEGRQQNRRVELVVTGNVIGIPLTSSLNHP